MPMANQTLCIKSGNFHRQKRPILHLIVEQHAHFNGIMRRKSSCMTPHTVFICLSVGWNNYQQYLKQFEVIKLCQILYDRCL